MISWIKTITYQKNSTIIGSGNLKTHIWVYSTGKPCFCRLTVSEENETNAFTVMLIVPMVTVVSKSTEKKGPI